MSKDNDYRRVIDIDSKESESLAREEKQKSRVKACELLKRSESFIVVCVTDDSTVGVSSVNSDDVVFMLEGLNKAMKRLMATALRMKLEDMEA